MKLYLNNIENAQNIIVFEEIQNDWMQDDNDDWYTTNQDTYNWWETLANAIDFLETKGIDTLSIMDVNELADYITIAKENGFNA